MCILLVLCRELDIGFFLNEVANNCINMEFTKGASYICHNLKASGESCNKRLNVLLKE